MRTEPSARKALYPRTLTDRVSVKKKKLKENAFAPLSLHQIRTDTSRLIHCGVELNGPICIKLSGFLRNQCAISED